MYLAKILKIADTLAVFVGIGFTKTLPLKLGELYMQAATAGEGEGLPGRRLRVIKPQLGPLQGRGSKKATEPWFSSPSPQERDLG